MSIDKIKQRIKMIESNDFTLKESYVNLSQSDYDTIIQNRTGMKTMSDITRGLDHATDANNVAKSALNVQTKYFIGHVVQLPAKHEKYVFAIYKLLKQHKMLSKYINDNNFIASKQYTVDTIDDKTENKLKLNPKNDIILFFKPNIKDGVLYEMHIKDLSQYNNENISNFVNDIETNKRQLNISNISKTGTEYPVIKIKYNL